MTRWLISGLALIVILTGCVYYFIPARLDVRKIVLLDCNRNVADRVLADTGNWEKWWPGTGSTAAGHARVNLSYQGAEFRVTGLVRHGAAISIGDDGRDIPSMLNVYPLSPGDSSFFQWQFTRDAGWNPFTRIGQFREASRLKASMAVILDSLRRYLGDPARIYGLSITEASTKDSFLIETKDTVKTYPNTGTIYAEVKKLDKFVIRRGGVRSGYPMVNIDSLSSGEFYLRTAIPVDKACKDSGKILFRKLVRGKYLETDVRGGPFAVNIALDRMKLYIADYRRTVMAIPFFSLVTDRTRETDSANWVTRIYYPIY